MCLAECRTREQPIKESANKIVSNMFEMVPHWPGIIETENHFQLTRKLFSKESLLDHKGILRLALELPPIMLPRRIKP